MTKQEFDTFCRENNEAIICYHDATGKYLFINGSVESLTGFAPTELINKNPYDFFHPDDKEHIEKMGHMSSLHGNVDTIVEYRFRKKNGEYIWFRTKTTPLKNEKNIITNLLTISTNISDLITLKNELIKQESLFDEASKMVQIGAWEADLKEMKITWSKVTYDIYELDYSYTPLFGGDVDDFFPGESATQLKNAVNSTIQYGTPYDLILPFITAKKNKIWIRSIGKALIRFGEIVKIYGVVQNITEEVEDKAKLNSIVDQLTGREKQLRIFNEMLSHNIRTPVVSVNTILEAYENSDDEDEKQELLSELKFISKSLHKLLDNLVDSVKVIQYNHAIETINIKDVIHHTKLLLEANIKFVHAEINIDLTGWTEIQYSKIYLESILLNLLSNAIKYGSPDRPLIINIKTTIEEGAQVLVISDTGIGINVENQQQDIFQMRPVGFKTRLGKGLGLFITKHQIEAMGGKITVESSIDKGTTFKIIFREPKEQKRAKSNENKKIKFS